MQALLHSLRRHLLGVTATLVLLALAAASAHAQLAGVHRELYSNLSRDAFSLARLTNDSRFLASQPSQTNIIIGGFTTEQGRGDDYGQRLRAFLTAPASGNYTFWIASDETSNLYLSTDENPANKRLIAWVDPRSQPGNYTTHFGQQSSNVALQAGRRYYVEVLHHEANLIDHLSVQWRLPAGTMESPIPNSRLAYEIAPLIVNDLTPLVIEEGRPALFAPQVANFLPQSWRWQRDGADLPGATNRTHSIPAVSLADSGALFRGFVTNRVGLTNTAEVLLTVFPDTNAPRVTAVVNANPTNVFVHFSEPVTAASALALAHYGLAGAAVLGAEFGANAQTVILRTTPLTWQNAYTLTLSNVLDRASAPNRLAATQFVFTAREFNAQSIAAESQPGSVTLLSGGANVTGGGTDIGGRADQFQFAWQSVTGDFDFRVRVTGMDFTDIWAKAGLMAREDLEPGSRFAAVLATPTLAGCFFQHRTNAGGFAISAGSHPASFPATWLRLKRAGPVFTGYAGPNGTDWTQLGSVSLAASNRLYFGLAVTSHNTNETATAQFREFSSASDGAVILSPPRTEPLGPSSRKTALVISEIMYHPRALLLDTNKAELEFVELFNSNPYYEDLSGYRLSGDIDYVFPPGTILPGGSFFVVAGRPADVQAVYGLNHVLGPFTGNLPNDRGRIRLHNNNDFVLLEVNYEGRHPWPIAADGAGHSLVLARPSYGENQREAWAASDSAGGSPGRIDPPTPDALAAIVINEFLAHSDAPLLDFIELYNRSAQPVDVGGAWLTDEAATNKFHIPSPTIIAPFDVVTFAQSQLGFSLNAAGERIFLVNSNQTRVLDAVGFDAQANGVSSGRFPDGTPGFQQLAARTPGTTNAPRRTPDIVINEIMYHPISENSDDEFVELFNAGTSAVDLGGWRFTDGISFTFPSNTLLAAGGYLVVAKNHINLLTHYLNLSLNPNPVVGDYNGTLDNDGERLALARPELAISADNSMNVTTNIIYVVVDEVEYRDGGRWGQWSDGGGSSLERIDPRADGRLAPNWADSDETGKAPWTTLEHTGVLDQGLDTPDQLYVMLLEEGECLLDDVEVLPQGAANRVANSNFETGVTGWFMRGNHERSSRENSGYNSAGSLRVRATARGDIGPNKIRVPLTSALASGQTATLRAKIRWLRGWPEILLRLRGGFLEATDRLIVPANLGTPGAPNSRLVANAGPAITETIHTPAVPAAGQQIVVTARVSDPDGVAAVAVKYRVDPSTNLSTVLMNDSGTGGDAYAHDGVYSATIPGQPADTLVAFLVEATDAAGSPASSRFPALRDDNAPARECLVHFGSAVPASSFGTYRFWITRQSVTNWSQREVLSNERIPGTFVYGNHRVIYNAGARYSGSAAHQDQAAPDYSPVGTPNNYALDMPRDDQLLGTDNFNKIHGAGNNHHDDNTLQREVTAYWMAQRLGLPVNHKRFVAMFINGARRGTLMEDTQVPNGEVIASVFPDDAEGDLFKIAVSYEFNSFTGQALTWGSSSEGQLNNFTTTGGVKKRARYRWNWQQRAVHGTANDFNNLYALVDTANTAAGPAFVQNMDGLVDMENWMRTFALEHAVGNWDSFGYRNEQNMFAYKPERGRWSLLIWDINIIFGGGTRGAPIATNENLLEIDAADAPMSTIYGTPAYRRAYWRALEEIAEELFVNANADPVMDARFAAFEASGVHVTAPNLIKHWISQRRTYILSELAKINAANFTVNGASEFTTATNFIALSGLAPVDVRTIEVNGIAWPVTWTTLSNWTLRLPLTQATNRLVLLGLNERAQPISGASNRVTVIYTGPLPSPEGYLVINEIHYHPLAPESSFVEIFNTSTNFTFDLSGWRLNGVDFTFPAGTLITNRQFLVVTKSRTAFTLAYGPSNLVAGEFDGQLDDGGETIALVRPGPTPDQDLIVDRVKYDDDPPWPAAGDGAGPSLQLIDAAQDNSRVSNWSSDVAWVFTSRTGDILNATNLLLWIQTAGNAYVDDITLLGPNGTNLLANGDFESELSPPWIVASNYAGSMIVSNLSHGGRRSLFLNGATAGGLNNALQQVIPGSVQPSNTYTLSFWCLANTNSVSVNLRTSPGNNFTLTAASRRVLTTPGAPNTVASTLAPFPPLWLNEVQPVNADGITDNASEREPWIELFNAGVTNVSLNGLCLSDDYADLTKWSFPPGAVLAPGEFRIIWADGETNESTAAAWHTGFRLDSASGSLTLAQVVEGRARVLDYFNFSGVGANLTYGAVPDGQPFERRVLHHVTPGTNNVAPPVAVFINEWLAGNTNNISDPTDGGLDDWFELFNAGSAAVDLTDYYLSDDLGDRTKFRIPAGYVVPPGGFLLVWADEDSSRNGPDLLDLHVNFRLALGGEAIGLYTPEQARVDEVTFGSQINDVSRGRFPDGTAAIHFLSRPTPRAPNLLGTNNAPPLIAPLVPRVVTLGQTLAFTVVATDPDPPLRFTLDGPVPEGATIGLENGLFTWTPMPTQLPALYTVTLRVTDEGAPPASAIRTFLVTVVPPPRLTGITRPTQDQVSLSWETLLGKTYLVEYKDELSAPDWHPLGGPRVANSTLLTVSDPLGARRQRFYRLTILD